jgi:hypothetical protein
MDLYSLNKLKRLGPSLTHQYSRERHGLYQKSFDDLNKNHHERILPSSGLIWVAFSSSGDGSFRRLFKRAIFADELTTCSIIDWFTSHSNCFVKSTEFFWKLL